MFPEKVESARVFPVNATEPLKRRVLKALCAQPLTLRRHRRLPVETIQDFFLWCSEHSGRKNRSQVDL